MANMDDLKTRRSNARRAVTVASKRLSHAAELNMVSVHTMLNDLEDKIL